MKRLLLAGLAVLAVTGACSTKGGSELGPSTAPSASATSASPTGSPSPTGSVSPSKTASPSASPVSGNPVGTSGSALRRVDAGSAVTVNADGGCESAYPELLDVSCSEIAMHGGSMLWVAGTEGSGDGRTWVLRLHTFDESTGGYVVRYETRDTTGTWGGFRVSAARLLGFGVDGLVVQTFVTASTPYRSYDVLNWRRGGPLVLSAHRGPLRQARVAVGNGSVEEYEGIRSDGEPECCPSKYVQRSLRWDGRQFRLASVGVVKASDVPAP